MGRLKPHYNAKPTARERAYHIWLMETYPCIHCGAMATVVHHPLTRHPAQRWRRDHEYVVTMCAQCHMDLHHTGSEAKFDPPQDYAARAAGFRAIGLETGRL